MGAGARPAWSASLAPLPECAARRGICSLTLVRSRVGRGPENSVVNGADTSTDGSIEWAALSPKCCVAPLLVKTCEVTRKTLKFCGELTSEMQCTRRSGVSEDEDSRGRRTSCAAEALRVCVERMKAKGRRGGAAEGRRSAMEDFAGFAQNQLYSELARKAVILLPGQFDAQAYIPTQPPPPLEDAWLPHAYEDQGWSGCAVAPSRQGTAPCLRVAGLPRLISKGSRPLAPGRQDANNAQSLPQCLYPLPLRCQRSLYPRNQGSRRMRIRRRVRLRATGDCTSMPTISACTRRAGSSSRH